MTVLTFQFWYEAYEGRWVSDTMWRARLWVPYGAMPVGLGILTLQYVVDLLNLLTGREPPFGIEVKERSVDASLPEKAGTMRTSTSPLTPLRPLCSTPLLSPPFPPSCTEAPGRSDARCGTARDLIPPSLSSTPPPLPPSPPPSPLPSLSSPPLPLSPLFIDPLARATSPDRSQRERLGLA